MIRAGVPRKALDKALAVDTLALSDARWFEPSEPVTDCRDAKDNKYLELMLAAGAETLVSSDEDLLVLTPWRGRRVMRPAEYLASIP
jgi:uncharacterized protein